jgi:hypothetical protein
MPNIKLQIIYFKSVSKYSLNSNLLDLTIQSHIRALRVHGP